MIAATYVMLAATEMGLATSPMNGWDEAKVKKVIGVEDRDDLAIALLVSVGYAAEERRHPGRRPVEQNVFHQRYGVPTNAALPVIAFHSNEGNQDRIWPHWTP